MCALQSSYLSDDSTVSAYLNQSRSKKVHRGKCRNISVSSSPSGTENQNLKTLCLENTIPSISLDGLEENRLSSAWVPTPLLLPLTDCQKLLLRILDQNCDLVKKKYLGLLIISQPI